VGKKADRIGSEYEFDLCPFRSLTCVCRALARQAAIYAAILIVSNAIVPT